MTLKSCSPGQKAEDRAILTKLSTEQELTESEEKRFDQLVRIAANNLGIPWDK